MDAPNVELLAAFASLYTTGKYSDLTIKSNSRTFAVHKVVICSRSEFFDGACSHPFREAATGIIDLSEDDDETVEHMIHYFYYLDYLSKPKSRRTSRPSSPVVTRSHSRRVAQRPMKFNLALVEDPLLAQAQTATTTETLAQSPMTPPTSAYDRSLDYFKTVESEFPPRDHFRGDVGDDDDSSSSSESEHEESDCDATQPLLVIHAKVYAIAENSKAFRIIFFSHALFTLVYSNYAIHYSYPAIHIAPQEPCALPPQSECFLYFYCIALLQDEASNMSFAYRYGITGLKALAKRKYATQLEEHWSSPEFADSIQEVYEATVDSDRGLRDLVIHAFREHPQLARSKDVEFIVRDTPGIAWELFRLGWGMPVY
ncbi:uncharacterized protein K452DRAFT_311047 [Aplosporella prunicola CBS 121167]|uniref:BTB domain-containing protein n=1 Tax=Aplosporella prunicola CBS 121167 TaxID=1176127 RepID=A0A6A6B794_9PEZI|nr:uncharacterized protein K452DRAFT_311047 [Aplosporella prunicola CBS 121167]KAF2139105.1 hypothetical protein K452DRAFT_311047 [Aplosporella prunicola CBS 121167]